MRETNPNAPRETWITGVGIVSCLGEGPDAHWQALDAGKTNVERTAFAPYLVHPLARVNFEGQSATNSPFHELPRLQFRGSS